VRDALFQCGCGDGQNLFGQVVVVDRPGHGDRADEQADGVHMMSAETGEPERAQWIANLDEVAALDPAFVVAGHKKVENDNDPKIIAESQQYLRDFSRIAAEETTAADIVARMVERYPDWGNLRTLWHSARTAVARNGS
jgi:hypothetical protein